MIFMLNPRILLNLEFYLEFSQGLSYLHDSSPFRYHGNLKPTNCLIDSRWNLKLSDFGLKPYEYKLRRTTDLIVPPTCNLATTTGGIAGRVPTKGNAIDDNIGSVPNTTFGVGGGGATFHQNNTHSVATGGGGGRSQSFGSSFHGQVLTQVTSPYLCPEYPLLIKVSFLFILILFLQWEFSFFVLRNVLKFPNCVMYDVYLPTWVIKSLPGFIFKYKGIKQVFS